MRAMPRQCPPRLGLYRLTSLCCLAALGLGVLPGCVHTQGVTIALPENQILVDAGGIPVVFRQTAGPTFVTITGEDMLRGRSTRGVYVIQNAEEYQDLAVEGFHVRRRENAVLLKWGSATFQVTPGPGQVVLVQGSKVGTSDEWFRDNLDLIQSLGGDTNVSPVQPPAPAPVITPVAPAPEVKPAPETKPAPEVKPTPETKPEPEAEPVEETPPEDASAESLGAPAESE